MAKRKVSKEECGNGAGMNVLEIPKLERGVTILRLVGDSPLLLNSKMSVAWSIAEQYQGGGGKTKTPKSGDLPVEKQYTNAFYTLPNSPAQPPSDKGWYGVPASGLKKCLKKGIRPSGITDNITIGNITNAFRVLDDEGGLCLIRHNGVVRDARPVSIPRSTVPQIRYRPLFHEWEIHLRVIYNVRLLGDEQLVNLANYAGQYIGLCEMRAEKLQGECGGFYPVSFSERVPNWAKDNHWGVTLDPENGFHVNGNGKAKRKR